MLGTAALAELPLSVVDPLSADALGTANAVAEGTAVGVGSLYQSVAANAVGECSALAVGSTTLSRSGVAASAAIAFGTGRLDFESDLTGFACAGTLAYAVARAEMGTVVTTARTRSCRSR